MLEKLFVQVFDMSKIASIVILVVLLARLLLKRAPKIISYALWAVVLFRLLCPTSIETPVSLVPEITPTAQSYRLAEVPISLADAGSAAYHALGGALNGDFGVQSIPMTVTYGDGSFRYVTADWRDVCIWFGQYVWAAGVAVMLLYSLISYGKIRRKLQVAVPLWDNIYIADDIGSPVVVGFLFPNIYLPCGLGEEEQRFVLRHEQHHIKRLDHIYKALAFLALCIHWFNPLVWIAFVLAGKDMEMSCDEAVVREMGGWIRGEYAASLFAFATGRRRIAGTPLAFGEGNAKERIHNLGKWKQPVVWAVTAAVTASLLLTVCLATNPTDRAERTRELTGLVTELQPGGSGDVTAIVIRTDKGEETGILLTAETDFSLPEAIFGTSEEIRTRYQTELRAELRPDMQIYAECTRSKKTIATDGGAQIPAYEARDVRVTGQLNRGAAALQDGTQIDVLENSDWFNRTYRLPDGTELLRENTPYGPEGTHVEGVECRLDDLSETAQAQVSAFYQRRGLLYDEQEELEKCYALYRALGADFRSGYVEQFVSPTAASDRVMHFLTTVTMPTGRENGNFIYEVRLGEAFDRETGAHIDTWDLFTAPREVVKKALLEESRITDQALLAEMEAAAWDGRIVFFSDYLSVEFEPGTLPSQPNANGFRVEYTPAVRALMQDWAVPQSAKNG